MLRLVPKAMPFAAEAVVAEQRLPDLKLHGLTALSDGVASEAWPLLRYFSFRVSAASFLLLAVASGCWCGFPRLAVLAVASSIIFIFYLHPVSPIRVVASGLLASLLIAPLRSQSYPPQYVATVWQAEQGLPQSTVNAILQDHKSGRNNNCYEIVGSLS